MMSNWPPLVAMSVVTRWRSTDSSIVTHFTVMPGLAASKCLVSFCISIMWPLLTVAMTSSVAANALAEANIAVTRAAQYFNFMECLLGF